MDAINFSHGKLLRKSCERVNKDPQKLAACVQFLLQEVSELELSETPHTQAQQLLTQLLSDLQGLYDACMAAATYEVQQQLEGGLITYTEMVNSLVNTTAATDAKVKQLRAAIDSKEDKL